MSGPHFFQAPMIRAFNYFLDASRQVTPLQARLTALCWHCSSGTTVLQAQLPFPWSWTKVGLKEFPTWFRAALGLLQHSPAAASCWPSRGVGYMGRAGAHVWRQGWGTGSRKPARAALLCPTAPVQDNPQLLCLGCFLLPQQRKKTTTWTKVQGFSP